MAKEENLKFFPGGINKLIKTHELLILLCSVRLQLEYCVYFSGPYVKKDENKLESPEESNTDDKRFRKHAFVRKGLRDGVSLL